MLQICTGGDAIFLVAALFLPFDPMHLSAAGHTRLFEVVSSFAG